MGHERIGFLPRTMRWQSIVHALEKYDGDPADVSEIAETALYCIRDLYRSIANNESLIKAIRYLAILCFSANSNSQVEYLNQHGFCADQELSLFALMKSARFYMDLNATSLEINKIAKDALIEALIVYKQSHETEQLQFIGFEQDNIWEKASGGSAFCEMARAFIASFTGRQLRYYLERIAAGKLSDYSQLLSFSDQLTEQTNAITAHTSDVSKIMQSFAAGWYNKYSSRDLPPDNEVSRFLSMIFKKVSEEFRMEGAEQ